MPDQTSPIAGLDLIRQNRVGFLILGIILILLGAVAVGEAFLMTVFSTKFLGIVMIIAGVSAAFHAFAKERGWGGFFIDLLSGILYVVVGAALIANPAASAVALTLLIAMVLTFEGLFRMVAAISVDIPNRGWVIIHGLITLVMGILIWRQWPLSGTWVIGLFIGISMIANGWSLVMLSAAAKNLPEEGGGEAAPTGSSEG